MSLAVELDGLGLLDGGVDAFLIVLACPGLPEPHGDHPLAQCLGRELVPVVSGQLLAGQRGAEVGIVGANQSQHLLANGVGQGVAGASTEAA